MSAVLCPASASASSADLERCERIFVSPMCPRRVLARTTASGRRMCSRAGGRGGGSRGQKLSTRAHQIHQAELGPGFYLYVRDCQRYRVCDRAAPPGIRVLALSCAVKNDFDPTWYSQQFDRDSSTSDSFWDSGIEYLMSSCRVELSRKPNVVFEKSEIDRPRQLDRGTCCRKK